MKQVEVGIGTAEVAREGIGCTRTSVKAVVCMALTGRAVEFLSETWTAKVPPLSCIGMCSARRRPSGDVQRTRHEGIPVFC
jgi:hypothetical protein